MNLVIYCGYKSYDVVTTDDWHCPDPWSTMLYFDHWSFDFEPEDITLVVFPNGRRRRVISINEGGALFGPQPGESVFDENGIKEFNRELCALELQHPVIELDEILVSLVS